MPSKSSSRKSKFKAAPFLFNVAVFLYGVIFSLEHDRLYIASGLFVVAILNLLVIKTSEKHFSNWLVLGISTILALAMTIDSFVEDVKYFSYLWLAAFIVSFGVTIISYKKFQRARAEKRSSISSNGSTKE